MTILCYHAVDPSWEHPLAVHPDAFADQCAWLSRRRRVLPLAEAVGRLDRSLQLPRGLAALTFDDGFASLAEHAMPSLRRFGLPATVFLVASTLTEQGQAVDWVDRADVADLVTLDPAQVQQMQAEGVDFQSHSYAHLDLTRLPFDQCVRDLRDSRQLLESLLHRPVTMLAYPRGRHDADVQAAAAAAGYDFAFALPERAEEPNPYAVPRVGLYRGNTVRNLSLKAQPGYLSVRTGAGFATARRLLRALRP